MRDAIANKSLFCNGEGNGKMIQNYHQKLISSFNW